MWINGHLANDLSLAVPANQPGMSERGLSRHYAEATSQTPARAIEPLRVEAARSLLSESRLPVGSEETMRCSFSRLLGTVPQDYRARFGTYMFPIGPKETWPLVGPPGKAEAFDVGPR
jgi:transcriptional regulator GlxA family with amidase domain